MNTLNHKLFYLAIVLMTCIGCEDILTETPRYQSPTGSFFQNTDSLDRAVTASYAELVRNQWDRGLQSARLHALFAGADDWTSQPGGNKLDWKQGDQLDINASNVNMSACGWSMPYDVILQANFAIQGRQKLLDIGEDETAVNAKAAEAYFLRAWGYFWLVRLYGGVPLVLRPEYDQENTNLKRASVEDVYDQVLSDLEFAIDYLPTIQSERGRVNQWAAKALQAEVYLTMAGWPLKVEANYALALADAQDVIMNGPYAFEPVFADIFALDREDTNTEYIWQLKLCGQADCPNSGLNTPFASQSTKPSELGGFQDLFIEKAFFNRFPEGARKDYTFLTELHSEDGSTIPWQDFGWKHPFLSKFYDGTVDKYAPYEPQRGTTAPNSGLDYPILRITEMMLIYAEAQVMGGGGDQATALEYLNMVRRRAKGVDVNSPDVDDLTSFTRQDIIDEKGWEFTGEMKRWFDLTRTETLADALADRDPSEMPLVGDPGDQNYYYLLLPSLDLSLNPNLEQNPR